MANIKKEKEREEYLICTDDTVIEKGIPTFPNAVREAAMFQNTFTGLNVYICKVIADANRI